MQPGARNHSQVYGGGQPLCLVSRSSLGGVCTQLPHISSNMYVFVQSIFWLCCSSPFPSQETDITVPSVQHHFQHFRRIWRQIMATLLRTVAQNEWLTDCHCFITLVYQVRQQVCLSTRDIHLKGTPERYLHTSSTPL